MVGIAYNPNNCAFISSQTLNANQFNGNVRYSNNSTTHNLLWDFVEQKIYWVNTQNNIIDAELSSSKIITLNYQELYNLLLELGLEQGVLYRLTDYKSVNFLNGIDLAQSNPPSTNPNFIPRQLHIGEEETLLLQAIDERTFSPIGYSEKYPQDIIQFNPYANKIGLNLDIANGNTLPNGDVVSDFDLKWDSVNNEVYLDMPIDYPILFGQSLFLGCQFFNGVDTYFQSGRYEILKPYINEPTQDFTYENYIPAPKQTRIRIDNNQKKIVLLDLTYTNFLQYVPSSLNVGTAYAIGDAYGIIQRRNDTINNVSVPCDFRGFRYRRFEVDLSALNSSFGTYYWGQGDNYLGQGTTGNFKDFEMFGSYRNINVDYYIDNVVVSNFRYNNITFFYNCTIYSLISNDALSILNSNINGVMINNKITSDFSNNLFVEFSNNICDGVSDCSFSENFTENIITTGYQFNTNTGIRFSNNRINGDFYDNDLTFFEYNSTNGTFFQNNISATFSNNIINDRFRSNIISGNGFAFNSFLKRIDTCIFNNLCANLDCKAQLIFIDFSTATIIYQNGNKTITQRSDGAEQIGYLDPTNTIIYNNITF